MAFEFKCVKMRETKHAVLVVDKETGEDVWMPLSQIYSMHFDDGGDGYMMISDWIAGEKGLG